MIRTRARSISSETTNEVVGPQVERINKIILILVAATYILGRVWYLTKYSLWGGETFILDGIHQSWTGMFTYVLHDVVHPPLFYVLVKLWISVFGESLIWMKLIPFIAAVITIIPFLLLCRELNLQAREVNLAFVLISVNGFLIHYAQEVRMYSLFACLSLFSLWLFVRYWKAEVRQRSVLGWLFLVNLLMVYTHYYGWLVIAMEFLYLAIFNRKKLILFMLSALLVFILFSPWAYLVIQSAINKGGLDSNVDWIPRPTIFHLRNFYSNFNGQLPFTGNMEIGLVLFSLPVFLWGRNIVWKRQKKEDSFVFWWLTLLVSLPVIIVFFISRLLYLSFWVDRYFIFVALPYFLLISIAIFHIQSKWVRTIMLFFVLVWSLFAGASDLITNRIAWQSPQLGSRVYWERLTRQIVQEENGTGEEIPIYALPVISNYRRTGDWAIMTSIQFYLDFLDDNRFQLIYKKDATRLLEVPDEHFWVASFLLDGKDPNGLLRYFRENGFRVGEVIQERQGNNRLILFPVWRSKL